MTFESVECQSCRRGCKLEFEDDREGFLGPEQVSAKWFRQSVAALAGTICEIRWTPA